MTFLQYLWKEWRDHRSILIGMAVAVPVLLVVAGLSFPTKILEGDAFALIVALACLALFVFALSTDLVPGEVRRGTLRFLQRLPGGVRAAFRAKLALFLGGAVAFTAYGWLLGGLTSLAAAGTFPQARLTLDAWPLAVFVVWTFALSCCLPRGVLSIPATAAVFALLAVPLLVFARLLPGLRPGIDALATPLVWGGGGLLAAWLAFTRGRRHVGGWLRPARWVLAVGVCCALPWWAEAASDLYAWHYESEPRIRECVIGPGGRYAFVNRYAERPGVEADGRSRRYGPLGPVIVDLTTGSVVEEPPARSGFYATWRMRTSVQPLVRLWRHEQDALFYDGATAARTEPTTEVLRAAARATAPYRLPDGRRAWPLEDRLECDDGHGGVAVLEEHWNDRERSPCGLGVTAHNGQGYYDFARGRSYRRRDLDIRGHIVVVRTGRWLAAKRRGAGGAMEFLLVDPETGATEPARGFEPDDRAYAFSICVHDDGRVLLARKGALVLIDPETGATETLATPRPLKAIGEGGRVTNQPTRTPGGARVYLLFEEEGGQVLTRFDGRELAVAGGTRGHVGMTLAGLVDEDTAIVEIDDRALWRVRFGSDQKEVLWTVD